MQADHDLLLKEIKDFHIEDIRLVYILLLNALHRELGDIRQEDCSLSAEHSAIESAHALGEVDRIFLKYLSVAESRADKINRDKYAPLITEIEHIVAREYSNDMLSMNMIAESLRMSPVYLGRLFKRAKAQTFSEYLTSYRLNKACILLVNTGKTVSEIADAVGFSNSNYFFVVFKRCFGCTPNQHRREASPTSDNI